MVFKRRGRGCLATAIFLALGMTAQAGPVDLKELDTTIFKRLRVKAAHHVEITLDGSMLRMAASVFADGEDADSAKIRRLVGGLSSITIRNFEFKKAGDYNVADLDAIRSQIKTSEWQRIVDAGDKDGNESSEVYILPGRDKPKGLFILTAEPLELTVVHILGNVDLKDIGTLEHLRLPSDEKDDK